MPGAGVVGALLAAIKYAGKQKLVKKKSIDLEKLGREAGKGFLQGVGEAIGMKYLKKQWPTIKSKIKKAGDWLKDKLSDHRITKRLAGFVATVISVVLSQLDVETHRTDE